MDKLEKILGTICLLGALTLAGGLTKDNQLALYTGAFVTILSSTALAGKSYSEKRKYN